MKLVIDRKRWLRGEGENASFLLRDDGKMCCLGFFACAIGVPQEQLLGAIEPGQLPECPWPEWLLRTDGATRRHTSTAAILAETNDSTACDANAREERIASIFASHGVEVTFVDGDETL